MGPKSATGFVFCFIFRSLRCIRLAGLRRCFSDCSAGGIGLIKIGPEAVEFVKTARFLIHNMHDNVGSIDQDPIIAFSAFNA